MAENVDDILKEIKTRKESKKGASETIGASSGEDDSFPEVEVRRVSDHKDLKEIALRVEGKK